MSCLPFSTCTFPFVTWQYVVITDLMLLRVSLYIYCVSDRLAKLALLFIFALAMPVLIGATILGQMYYSTFSQHLDCVSAWI